MKSERYFATKFKNLEMPADFRALAKHQDDNTNFFNRKKSVEGPLSAANAKLLLQGRTHPLISHNYLNDKDRENDDTMWNVAAMNETAEKFIFIAVYRRCVLGYWLGCSKSGPVLFRLDTEGQYRICEGETLAQTLCYDAFLNGNAAQFEKLQKRFATIGIYVEPKTDEAIYAGMDDRKKRVSISPQTFRHERYNAYRQDNGLKPIN